MLKPPPGNDNPVIPAARVAELLNCTEGTFLNKRRKLERAGFPEKLPAINGWSRKAVMRWIDSNAGRDADEPRLEIVPDGRDNLLERRYAQ